MGRIISIDYGTKRTGLAVTDPLQLIVSGLDTVATAELFDFLDGYFNEEEVETIVVGEPFYPDGTPSQITHLVVGLVRKLKKRYPDKKVVQQDESYTSEEAKEIIRRSGAKQKKRKDKSLIDKVSAVLILQHYLEEHK